MQCISKTGEEIVVSNLGEEAILARMVAEGSISSPKPKKRAATRFKPIRIGGKKASGLVAEDRRNSRY